MNDANEQRRSFVAEWVLVVFAAGILPGVCAAAGPAQGQDGVLPGQRRDLTGVGYAPAQEGAPEEVRPPRTAPQKPQADSPVHKESFEPPKTKYRPVTRDGKSTLAPEDGSQDYNPVTPRPYGPRGRARAVKELVEGDPTAWTVALGIVVTMVLAAVVSQAFRGPRKTAPGEIAASWQKQRVLCMACYAGN